MPSNWKPAALGTLEGSAICLHKMRNNNLTPARRCGGFKCAYVFGAFSLSKKKNMTCLTRVRLRLESLCRCVPCRVHKFAKRHILDSERHIKRITKLEKSFYRKLSV